VVAFNVDPLFNNAVDGLMYIRIADIPESTMKPVMEEFQAELERKLTEKKINLSQIDCLKISSYELDFYKVNDA
jgi:hypothetical protein